MSAVRMRTAGLALLLSGSWSSSSEFATTLTPTPLISIDGESTTIASLSSPCDPSSVTAEGGTSGYRVAKRLWKHVRASSIVSSSVAWKIWGRVASGVSLGC